MISFQKKKKEPVAERNHPLEGIQADASVDDKNAILQEKSEMLQNLLVNAVKATQLTVDRAFVLVDYIGHRFDIFYQQNGRIVQWNELENENHVEVVKTQLLPQAEEFTAKINVLFAGSGIDLLAYSELQFEWATKAWFTHDIYSDSEAAKLNRDEIFNGWVMAVSPVALSKALDSDEKMPWYPAE